jgi:predicted CoA-substrate-specific enzyme activase
MLTCGIDAGSRAIKIVVIDARDLHVVGSCVADQGVQQDQLARTLYDGLLADHGISPDRITRRIATGYGRNIISFADKTITEITCHAVGVHHVCPQARTVIDIGGQDSKTIRLGSDGTVEDFAMNDRCAAGCGRFLEILADRLGYRLDQLGEISATSTAPAIISSMCVVFAETEIIGLLAGGAKPQDVVAGVQSAIASRIAILAGRKVAAPVAFTGGVARIPGMNRMLAEVLEQPVHVVPNPQMTGALGAAILAARI